MSVKIRTSWWTAFTLTTKTRGGIPVTQHTPVLTLRAYVVRALQQRLQWGRCLLRGHTVQWRVAPYDGVFAGDGVCHTCHIVHIDRASDGQAYADWKCGQWGHRYFQYVRYPRRWTFRRHYNYYYCHRCGLRTPR